jgi:hypothetical protein
MEVSEFRAQTNRVLGSVKEYAPADLGLSAVDLKSVTDNTGTMIDVSGIHEFILMVEYVIVGTAPTVGTVDTEIEVFAGDKSTILVPAQAILRLTSTQSAGTYRTSVSWGWGDPAVVGTGTFPSGATDLDPLKVLGHIKVHLNTTTAYDQTGAKTASVWLKGRA